MKYIIEKKIFINPLLKNKCNTTFVLTTKKGSRINAFLEWFNKYPLTDELYIVYNNTSYKLGKNVSEDIGYSEEYIFKYADELDLNNFFYFEDDAYPFKTNIRFINWFISTNLLKNIDVLRLGHLGLVYPSFKIGLMRILNGGCFHASIITKHGCKKILNEKKTNKKCIDSILLYNGMKIKQYTLPIPFFYQLFKKTDSKKEWSNAVINKVIYFLQADRHPYIFILFYLMYVITYLFITLLIFSILYKLLT